MNSEVTTMSELLEQRRISIAALALLVDIHESTALRIVNGQSKPRGETAVRMAEALGIGYGRMHRTLRATWAAAREAEEAEREEAAAR